MQLIDHYRLSCLLSTITTGALAVFVLLVAYRQRVPRLHSLYTLTIFAWAICWYWMVTAGDLATNLFYGRLLHAPASFIPFCFLLFVQALLNIDRAPQQILLRKIIGTGSCLCLFLVPLKLFLPTAIPKVGFPYFLVPGPLYILFIIFFFVSNSIVFSLLIRGYKNSSGFFRVQIAHLLGAYSLGYLGAIEVFLPLYRIHMSPVSLYLISVSHVWMFYAIIRHRLLDIRIFIRRTGLLIAIYAALLITLIAFLKKLHSDTSIPLQEILIAGIVLSIGPFLYAFVVRRSTFFHEDTIAGLTHEMKTPLAAIQSAIEIIELQTGSANEDARVVYMNIIRANASRLQGFTESLVQLFGNDDSKIPLSCTPSDLRHLCSQAGEGARDRAKQKGLEIHVHLPDVEVRAAIDSTKIEQVLSNLFSNAIKFTDHGSISLTLLRQQHEAHIIITDTGAGLRADEIPRIFDRFYQGEAGRRKKGTGIGLTLAKNWVEAHGGKIWAESAGEGQGTVVTFTLPIGL